MTKTEFQTTLRGAVSQEFSNIPAEEDIICQFSASFEKRMDKLIRKERAPYRKWLNTTAKRVAAVILLFATLLCSSMNVEAIRKPVLNFFTEIYTRFIRIIIEESATTEITYKYSISSIPEGYVLTDLYETPLSVTSVFKNQNGNTLYFEQSISGENEMFMDNEHGTISSVSVNGLSVILYEQTGYSQALWSCGEYRLFLYHYGPIDRALFLDTVASVQ